MEFYTPDMSIGNENLAVRIRATAYYNELRIHCKKLGEKIPV